MNREAVALGTRVLTVFGGRLGAVDERLLAEGRLGRLTEPGQAVPVAKAADEGIERVRRNPEDFLNLLLRPLS